MWIGNEAIRADDVGSVTTETTSYPGHDGTDSVSEWPALRISVNDLSKFQIIVSGCVIVLR